MQTGSTPALCTVAEHEDFHTVALYSSQELDELTAQLEAIARSSKRSRKRAALRSRWEQLAFAFRELAAEIELGGPDYPSDGGAQ